MDLKKEEPFSSFPLRWPLLKEKNNCSQMLCLQIFMN
jgi:hypothetical protein